MILEGHLLFPFITFLFLNGQTKKQIYRINIRRLYSSILKEAATNDGVFTLLTMFI